MIKKAEDIPPRILVVDDEPQIGKFLYEFLTHQGYEVFCAESGEEALRFVKRVRPHIVLLDVRMLGMTGLQTLPKIVELDPRIGIIMVTALQEEEVGRQSLKLGAADFISKPIDLNYLITSITVKLGTMLD